MKPSNLSPFGPVGLVLAASALFAPAVACGAAPTGAEDTATASEALETPSHGACRADSDCTEAEFCDTEASGDTCGGSGVCQSRGDGACPDYDVQLCGCDGHEYGNSCFAHQAGVFVDANPYKTESISSHQLQDNPWMDQGELYFYTFTEGSGHNLKGGTFEEHTEPACTRSEPACEIDVEPQYGTFTIVGSKITLAYDNGNAATFKAKRSCTKAWELIGNDFGAALTLTASTIPQ
jgi:hypothetical protein